MNTGAMNTGATVLKDPNLFQIISAFEPGVPWELVEIIRLAQTIIISPCYTLTGLCPKAYLSNIPPRFSETPYLKGFKLYFEQFRYSYDVPNYALFLNNYYNEPTLPLHLSIVENNVKHVALWIKHKPEWLRPEPLKLAAICGHYEIVKLLTLASKNALTPEAMNLAAMNGYLDIVEWLHHLDDGPGCTTSAMDKAATYGHLNVVQFLNEHRNEGCTYKALYGAARNGYANVVEYLLNNRRGELSSHEIYDSVRIECFQPAKDKDYLGVLKALYNYSRGDIDEETIYAALSCEPLPILHYLIEQNIYGVTKKVLDTLLEAGDKHAIRYALEHLLALNNKAISLLDNDEEIEPWTPINDEFALRSHWGDSRWSWCEAMDIAARLGDLDTIKLLHRSGIKCCTEGAMNAAAAQGRMDIVEWLHTHRTEGCTENALTLAAEQGHLNMVQWLHQVYGLNCTQQGLTAAAGNGHASVVSYLISSSMAPEGNHNYNADNCPTDQIYQNALAEAAANGHINVIEILSEYPTTTDAMDRAIKNEYFDMVQYLHTHRNEGCTTQGLIEAIRSNRLDILMYLVENNCCRGEMDYEKLCVEAASVTNIEMLAFCINQLQSDLSHDSKQNMMFQAAKLGLIDVFKWLHETKGFGWSSVIQQVAQTRGQKKITCYMEERLKLWSAMFV